VPCGFRCEGRLANVDFRCEGRLANVDFWCGRRSENVDFWCGRRLFSVFSWCGRSAHAHSARPPSCLASLRPAAPYLPTLRRPPHPAEGEASLVEQVADITKAEEGPENVVLCQDGGASALKSEHEPVLRERGHHVAGFSRIVPVYLSQTILKICFVKMPDFHSK
jgi:hypothetical protein